MIFTVTETVTPTELPTEIIVKTSTSQKPERVETPVQDQDASQQSAVRSLAIGFLIVITPWRVEYWGIVDLFQTQTEFGLKRIVCLIVILIIQLLSGCIPSDDRETRPTDFTTARLLFDQAGYYQLNSQTMRKAGLEVNGIEEILLSYKNQPYPFWYENHANDQDFTLYFYVPEQFDRVLTQIIMLVKTDNKTAPQSLAHPLNLENITSRKNRKNRNNSYEC